jgi:hypothetical protein
MNWVIIYPKGMNYIFLLLLAMLVLLESHLQEKVGFFIPSFFHFLLTNIIYTYFVGFPLSLNMCFPVHITCSYRFHYAITIQTHNVLS